MSTTSLYLSRVANLDAPCYSAPQAGERFVFLGGYHWVDRDPCRVATGYRYDLWLDSCAEPLLWKVNPSLKDACWPSVELLDLALTREQTTRQREAYHPFAEAMLRIWRRYEADDPEEGIQVIGTRYTLHLLERP